MNYYLLLVLALAIKDEWMTKLFHRRLSAAPKQHAHI